MKVYGRNAGTEQEFYAYCSSSSTPIPVFRSSRTSSCLYSPTATLGKSKPSETGRLQACTDSRATPRRPNIPIIVRNSVYDRPYQFPRPSYSTSTTYSDTKYTTGNRIVEREVAMPLSEFQTGKQLVALVLHAVVGTYIPHTVVVEACLIAGVAHWDAHDKAGIMHCDVSGGNILIPPRST
ncbi:hypothetical protein C8Q79DRAFT_1045601 [Trametes meyenii]|nr:hypothetical protein C8Q79DRAFT_1045601 [Trametes meyenii]